MSADEGFMAAIVEQSGSKKSAMLSNEASTIVEKFQTPMTRADYIKDDSGMTEFGEPEFLPTLYLSDKQLPSALGLVVGDRVILQIEAEVCNYSYNENDEGKVKHEYTFELNKGVVKKIDK